MYDHLKDNSFPCDFRYWLIQNAHIFIAFKSRADEMRQVRKHYSARTICELIRWNTDLSEKDKTFKLNGNWVPYLAKLYNLITGSDFFLERKGVIK